MLSDLLCLRRLSGRALPSEGRGRGFESHRGHRAVVQARWHCGRGCNPKPEPEATIAAAQQMIALYCCGEHSETRMPGR